MQKRKKVLVNFVDSLPNQITGISAYAFRILEALATRKTFDYALLTNWDSEMVPAAIRDAGVPILQVRTAKTEKVAFPQSVYLAYKASANVGADLIFTPHPYGSLIGGRARVMVIHDLYRQTHTNDYRWDRRWSWNGFMRMTVARSSAIICVSAATQAEFQRYYPRHASKSIVIHEASPIERTEHGSLPSPSPSLFGLMVANASPNKNFDCVLSALTLLREQGVMPSIYWVGRDKLEYVARLRANYPGLHNFIALGSIEESHLKHYYANATFFINASTTEGFCLPILEAQSCGVAVICSDIPVLREVAGDGALFFNPTAPPELAAQIRNILTSRDLRSQVSRQGASNLTRFSWSEAASKTEAVFSRCLGAF